MWLVASVGLDMVQASRTLGCFLDSARRITRSPFLAAIALQVKNDCFWFLGHNYFNS